MELYIRSAPICDSVKSAGRRSTGPDTAPGRDGRNRMGTVSELPGVIGVDQVCARYGLRDRPAARKVMRSAGAFVIAGRLMVRLDDLDAFERRQAEASRRMHRVAPRPRRHSAVRTSITPKRYEPLPPGWWRLPEQEAA
jgi:hypothetical protein